MALPDTKRDQVPMASIVSFEWTSNTSAAYRVAAVPDKPVPGRGDSDVLLPPASDSKNTGKASLDGSRKANQQGVQHGANGPPRKSSAHKLLSAISTNFGTGRVVPLGVPGRTGRAGTGGGPQLQRRATHAGVVDSGETPLGLNVLHYSPQEFMDPDTAAAQVRYVGVEPARGTV